MSISDFPVLPFFYLTEKFPVDVKPQVRWTLPDEAKQTIVKCFGVVKTRVSRGERSEEIEVSGMKMMKCL